MKRSFVYSGPMAIAPAAFGAAYDSLPEEARQAEQGPVAVVRVHGPMTQYQEPFSLVGMGIMAPPPDSYESILMRAEAAFASNAQAVILELCSPGGLVGGMLEAASSLRAMADRSGKPFIAYLTGQCASAAYGLACAADQVYATSSTMVGSIGVIDSLLDKTAQDKALGLRFTFITSGARKADGQPSAGTTDDMVTARQQQVDDLAGVFHEWVASRRGVDVNDVQGLQASTMIASKALDAGLIDGVTTWSGILAQITNPQSQAASAAQQQDNPMKMSEVKAKLKALAEGDDEKEAARAKRALKAMEEDDESEGGEGKKAEGNEDKGDDEEAKKAAAAAAAAAASGESDDEDKDKGEAKGAAASAATSPNLEQRLAAIERAEAMRVDAQARAQVFGTRPDLSDAQKQALASVPTSALEAALKAIPKVEGRTYQPPAQAAQATVGSGQGGEGPKRGETTKLSEYASELDQQMGMSSRAAAIREEGGNVVFSAVGKLS